MLERNCPLVHVSVAVTDADRRRLLLVREAKEGASHGKWNLPGGHMERGEGIVAGALRELAEETHLSLELEGLLRIYSGPVAIRFVFLATLDAGQEPRAGHEIMAVWFAPVEEIAAMADEAMVGNLRQIVRDLPLGRTAGLEVFQDRG